MLRAYLKSIRALCSALGKVDSAQVVDVLRSQTLNEILRV